MKKSFGVAKTSKTAARTPERKARGPLVAGSVGVADRSVDGRAGKGALTRNKLADLRRAAATPLHVRLLEEYAGEFMAADHLRGHFSFPKFYHPWDPERNKSNASWSNVELGTAIDGAQLAVTAINANDEGSRTLSIMMLGTAARRIGTELARLAAEGNSIAAEQLWQLAVLTTTSLDHAQSEFLKNLCVIASKAEKRPAMVGTLAEDREAVVERTKALSLATKTSDRRHPRNPGKSGRTPSISGTPITALASEIIGYLECIRSLNIFRGNVDDQLEHAGITPNLFEKIRALPSLRNAPEIVTSMSFH